MAKQSIVMNTMQPDRLRSQLAAVSANFADGGHRTRPGLTPYQAAQELIHHSQHALTAAFVWDQDGAVFTIRYRSDTPAREAWEGVAVAGHPGDDLYRQAYQDLFRDDDRPAPALHMEVLTPPVTGPKDPRPTHDGWAVSVWFYDQTRRFANATRLIVQHYEHHLEPDLANYREHLYVLRKANPGE